MAKQLDNVTFSPKKQSFVPFEEGTYPAHIKSLETKERMTMASEAIIVNMSYEIHEDAANQEQYLYEMDGYNYRKDVNNNKIPMVDEDGNHLKTNCTQIVGRTFYDNGFFIFTATESANKNSRYFKLLEGLGIELEESNGMKKLVLIEEEDVIGLPVHVTLATHSYITSDTKDLPPDQQVTRTLLKAKEIVLWEDGEKLSQEDMDDDVRF